MLHDFVTTNGDEIIRRARARVERRSWPAPSVTELADGVPLFLAQLSETLRRQTTTAPFPQEEMRDAATRHARALLARGFTVAQVVHDYGDIGQVITELAVEQNAPIQSEEFQVLNQCLDAAIAEAVTEHARITAEDTSHEEAERLGQAVHELRNHVQTALLSYYVLRDGKVGATGSTGAVLGRSLVALRDLIDNTISHVRLAAGPPQHDRIPVRAFIEDVTANAGLLANYHGIRFGVEPVDPALAVHADTQLLASAVMNLLQNAFKYTRNGGDVVLKAHRAKGHLVIEVADECGGIAESDDVFRPFGERRGKDRSGLGLGLSIARKAVRAHGGEITIRNVPAKGCVFAIELPLTDEEGSSIPSRISESRA
jgi:signal transduction histidine kinase